MHVACFFTYMKHLPRHSTLSADVEQLSLIPHAVKKPSAPVDHDYLCTLGSSRRALRYAMSLRDLEPKQVYDELKIDKSTWSKIENGIMSFPIDELKAFNAIVGNDALLLWHVNNNGYDMQSMRRLQDDKDREIGLLKAELEEERREKQALYTVLERTRR